MRFRDRNRSGVILPWLALSLAVIVGVLAINLDGGRIMTERRHNQAAADAAALAAANKLYANWWTYHDADSNHQAENAAEASANANGIATSDVTVSIPPTAGAFAGQAGYVEVTIETKLPATFGRFFSTSPTTVRARSVARGMPMKIGVILLRPTGADAFRNNGVAFTVLNNDLIVNSNDAQAFHQTAFGLVAAKNFYVTGGANTGGAIVLGKMHTGVRPTPDPLALLPVPDTSTMTVRSGAALTINSILPTVLRPGVYKGGIAIRGLSIVVMTPGVYVMEGGGFTVQDTATVTGLETTIYNTSSVAFPAGPISVGGLSRVVLTAPLSGTYQGIAIFQNRGQSTPISVIGGGVTAMTGVVYGVRAPVNLTGAVGVGVNLLGSAYVVDSMSVSGIGAINVDLGLNPPRVPDVRVVE